MFPQVCDLSIGTNFIKIDCYLTKIYSDHHQQLKTRQNATGVAEARGRAGAKNAF